MIGALARKFFGSANDRRVKGYQSRVNAINALEGELAKLSDDALKARTADFRQQIVEARALGQAGAEYIRLRRQRLLRKLLHRRLERIDLRHAPLIRLERAVVGGAEEGAGDAGEHACLPRTRPRRVASDRR